ncbi:hypothetical protein CA233_19255 [Sphingomonas sp. ABOLD]|uniref:Uncharacterized protein n=1 Tax=Sphingomonas trueperi TaxID=53317 RepID=A0A7X6BDK3_9SPHN|nr:MULTISPECIES: hypothetical protein [Sphingomonas]NJB98385.1 hypothetical protein [Sphingomonas trueperi]RSV40722.1 hypothetical protein CA233_19255 [Sphingomonas sp. ABOLD]RSV41140.1 hypothetical protein CA234_10050 [Sphingomonas sp. ABOLE]
MRSAIAPTQQILAPRLRQIACGEAVEERRGTRVDVEAAEREAHRIHGPRRSLETLHHRGLSA